MGIADCHNKEESHWETDVIQLEWVFQEIKDMWCDVGDISPMTATYTRNF